MKEELSITKLS